MNRNASTSPANPANTPPRRPSGNRSGLIMLLCDLIAPVALFYALRAAGAGVWLSVLLSGVAPLAHGAYQLATQRKIDRFALFVIALLIVGAIVSFLTGDPRLLLAKDGWTTGLAGLWFLASVRFKEPFLLTAIRPFMLGDKAVVLEQAWAKDHVRAGFRRLTVLWGCVLLLDAVVRVILAYTLPIDSVPLVSTIQYLVLILVLQGFAQIYGRRHGILQEFRKKPAASPLSAQSG